MQREGQARQGCLKRVCPRALQGRKANQAHTDPRPTKSESDSANVKPYKHTDDCSTKSEGDSAKKAVAVGYCDRLLIEKICAFREYKRLKVLRIVVLSISIPTVLTAEKLQICHRLIYRIIKPNFQLFRLSASHLPFFEGRQG